MYYFPQIDDLKDVRIALGVIQKARTDAIYKLIDKMKELDMTPNEMIELLVKHEVNTIDISDVANRMKSR